MYHPNSLVLGLMAAICASVAVAHVGPYIPWPDHHGFPSHTPSLPTIRIPHGLHIGTGHHGPFHNWPQLKGVPISHGLADKLFPFTIRIASHGEPHLP